MVATGPLCYHLASEIMWDVEYTDEFAAWWDGLTAAEQDAIDIVVDMLQVSGPHLEFPHTSQIKGSAIGHLRELRKQHAGRPYRVLYAFDPRRTAILLIGGDKTGDGRWYKRFVPVAERLYVEHVDTLRKEGLI